MMTMILRMQTQFRASVWLVSLATILFFVSERYVADATLAMILKSLAAVFGVLAVVFTFLSHLQSKKEENPAQARCFFYSFVWTIFYVLSFALYLAYNHMMGDALAPTSAAQKLFLGGWLVTLIVSFFSGVGIELAMRSSGFGKGADARRVVRLGGGWMMVGLLLSSLIALNYAGAEKDRASDWTYLKMTEPGSSTRSMLASLDKELTVHLFFPGDNEVLPYIDQYFKNMAQSGNNIKIERQDTDLNPVIAEELKVSRNGQVVLQMGEERQRIDVGLDLGQARKKLRSFDSEFQKAFLKLTAEQKTIYFTSGHGELTWLTGSENPLQSIRIVEKLLRDQNYRVRQLSVTTGAAVSIPEDASAVVIAGPTRAFLKAEVEILSQYVQNGGKLMVLLDVEREKGEGIPGSEEGPGAELLEFLKRTGVMFKDEVVANEGNYVSATRSPADRWFIYTNNFASHDSVLSLAKHEENIPLLLFRSGHFIVKEKTGPWRVTPTVRSLQDSFADLNRNFTFDKASEAQKTYTLAAAVTYEPEIKSGETAPVIGKIIVAGDVHIISDAVAGAGSPANLLFLLDGLKWLAGESEFAGEVQSEEDVKIRHNRKENLMWFHSSVYGVPLFILLVGFIATRRRKVR